MIDDRGRATRITDVGVASSVSAAPIGRVVDLVGSDRVIVDMVMDPLPDDSPVTISVVVERAARLATVVDDIVCELTRSVIALFPAWLPGAEHLGDAGRLDLAALPTLARRLADGGAHSPTAVVALAAAALGGPDARASGLAPELLARESARLIAGTYRRDHVCLAVSRGDPAADDRGWSPAHQQVVGAACEWLARHAGVAVCLIGDPLPDIDRFTPMPWTGAVDHEPAPIAAEPDAGPPGRPDPTEGAVVVRLPALAGRPHPNSPAEQRLHAYLQRQDWADGARWNMTFAPDPLAPPIRVDVGFPAARCVVEIDGDDHRAPLKFAADRRRDNMLALAGFTVLRFTSDDVIADVATVADTIGRCLRTRPTLQPSTPTTDPDREARHR